MDHHTRLKKKEKKNSTSKKLKPQEVTIGLHSRHRLRKQNIHVQGGSRKSGITLGKTANSDPIRANFVFVDKSRSGASSSSGTYREKGCRIVSYQPIRFVLVSFEAEPCHEHLPGIGNRLITRGTPAKNASPMPNAWSVDNLRFCNPFPDTFRRTKKLNFGSP